MTIDARARAAASAAAARTRELRVPSTAAIVHRFTRRRRRRTMAYLVLALGVGVGVVIPIALFSGGSTGGRVSVGVPPVTSPPGSIRTRFVPPVHVDGNTAIVSITTPDGTRVELRYPRSLAIAESGFATGASIEYCGAPNGIRCSGVTPSSYMISYATLSTVYGAAPPLATYRDLNGQTVGYYQAPNPGGRPSSVAGTPDTTLNAVAIQIGPWLLQIPDQPVRTPLPATQTPAVLALANTLRAITVASIGAHLDGDGYLVLDLKSPLSFTPFRSLKDLLVFGGTETARYQLSVSGQQYCTGPGTDTTRPRRFTSPGAQAAAAWCDPRSHLHLSVIGTRRFVAAASQVVTLRILSPSKPTAVECPSARQPLSGSPDGLPMLGQTDQSRVQDIEKTQQGRIRRQFPGIVHLTVEPRDGQVWERDASGVITVRAVHDYWIVAQLRTTSACPSHPWTWDGIPLRLIAK